MSEPKPPHALYSQVKEQITEQIKSGRYRPGDQLPTEAELCESYGVSRTTIRLALQQLVLEGRIYRVQGRGSFVSKPKLEQSVTFWQGFAEQMRMQGHTGSLRLIELNVIPCTAQLSLVLQLQENDPVNRIVRTRLADDEPIWYEISYIPWKLAPGLTPEDCTGSLFRTLAAKYKLPVARTVEYVEPVLADGAIGGHLRIAPGTPIFYMETNTFGMEGAALEYSQSYFRGDRAKLVIERSYPETAEE